MSDPAPVLPGSQYAPPNGPPAILHADEHLLFAMKPPGLLSVPGRGEDLADCMMSRLEATHPGVLLVHRLDRDTSGVMVFALMPGAQRHLGLQFERRVPTKTYVARVRGRLEPGEGTVDLPLAVDWPNRPLHRVDHANGRAARTDWRVVRASDAETRVRLTPRTGRTHQLRVHMLSLGHPILGDPFYAPETAAEHPRMMLHSQSLRLRHPDGGAWMTVSAAPEF